MKPCFCAILSLTFVFSLRAEPASQQQYLAVYLERHDGEELEKQKDYLGALVRFKIAAIVLEKMRDNNPDWEVELVNKCIKDSWDEVKKLEPLAANQVLAPLKTSFAPEPSLSHLYDEACRMESTHKTWDALSQFEAYRTSLEIIHHNYPEWEKDKIQARIQKAQTKIDRLEALVMNEDAAQRAKNSNSPAQQ